MQAELGRLGTLLVGTLGGIAVEKVVGPLARRIADRIRGKAETLLERTGEEGRTAQTQGGENQEAELEAPQVFHSISQFWAAGRRILEGKRASLNGALSEYIPVLVGAPRVKRELHREFRRQIPEEDYRRNKTTVDALLAFTAGQMVWRPQPLASRWSLLGLYHSIVRNSILVFVDKDYYSTIRGQVFPQGQKVVEAAVTGHVVTLEGSFLKDFVESHQLQGFIRPDIYRETLESPIALVVDGEGTEIKYEGQARYLDGDIWVAVETKGEQFFLSRFVDLADENDLQEQLGGLADDVKLYLPNGEIVFQFDQTNRLFAMTTKEDLISRAINPALRRPQVRPSASDSPQSPSKDREA